MLQFGHMSQEPSPIDPSLDARAQSFALAAGDGTRKLGGPLLDPSAANSPLADAMRLAGIDESKIANTLLRCLDSQVGRSHVEFVKLAREFLGYRAPKPEKAADAEGSGADSLARAVAAAMDQARLSRIQDEEDARRESGVKRDGIGPGTLGAEVLGS